MEVVPGFRSGMHFAGIVRGAGEGGKGAAFAGVGVPFRLRVLYRQESRQPDFLSLLYLF